MRTTSLLHALGAALVGAVSLISACGTTVNTATGGSGGSIASTGDGAPGTGGALTGPGTGGVSTGPGTGGGFVDGGPPFDAGPVDAFVDTGTPVDSGPTCPGGGDTCTDCLSVSCSGAYCSCYGNVDCTQLLTCYAACTKGDMACYQACETAHQDGISAAFLLSGCAATQCPGGCPGNTALTPCQQCLYQKCDVQMNACVANPECVAYFACTKPCAGNATCLATCQSMHPNGLVDGSKVSTCGAVNCPGLCQ